MAKGNVGKLNILVGTGLGPLKAGLNSAVGLVKGFTNTLTSGFTGIGGLIAGAGLTVGLKSAADSMDRTAKAASTLGIGTENLVGLQHAANMAGVDAETLNASLAKMLSTVGHSNLGLVADQIAGISDPVARAAAASEIFGRNWRVMMPLLMGGSSGLRAASTEAQRLNMTFSQLDAAKVSEANDAITKMQGAIKGAFQLFATEMAPAITESATSAAYAFAGIAKTAIATFKAITNEVAFTIGTWKLQWELLKVDSAIAWETIKSGFFATFAAIKAGAIAFYNNFKAVFVDLGALVVAFASGMWKAIQAAFALENPITAFTKTFEQEFAKRSSGGFAKVGTEMADAYNNSFQKSFDAGLFDQRERITDQLSEARTEFDKIQVEAGTKQITAKPETATETGAAATVNAVSGKLAAASQFGTTEAASQIFAAMSARVGKDDMIARNTGDTAEHTKRTADALEKLELPYYDVLREFAS